METLSNLYTVGILVLGVVGIVSASVAEFKALALDAKNKKQYREKERANESSN